MANVSAAKWQDQAQTVLIATINDQEYSGIHEKGRFWNLVHNSGVTIDPFVPRPVELPEANVGDIWEILKAQFPQLTDADLPAHVIPPRSTPGGP